MDKNSWERKCDGKECKKSWIYISESDKLFCKFHLYYSDLIHPSEFKYNNKNIQFKVLFKTIDCNNNNLCHRLGCLEKDYLFNQFRGYFCFEHLIEISKIRENITHDNSIEDICYHIEEYGIRKIPCKKHIKFILNNYNKLK